MNDREEKLLSQCKVQAYKASGKGGQHVQKTDSAIRLIHLPTGIRVSSQQERSQYLNKKICLGRLSEKLRLRAKKVKKRIPIKKSRLVKAKEKREKQKHSEKKQTRKVILDD